MKKVTAIILIAMLLLFAAACGKAEQPSGSAPESTAAESTAPESTGEESTEPSEEIPVQGTVHDFGRFSALIPEGWELADLGDYQAEYNGVIVKGKGEDFMTASSASIIYIMPYEMAFSGRGFYDNSRNEGEFDLGGRHWEAWSATSDGMSVLAAESFDDFSGSVFVTLNMPEGSNDKLTLEDPDVRAILESIVVVPTVDVEWITLKDGIVYAQLPEVEGYAWGRDGTMNMNGFNASVELDGNMLTITPTAGTGAFSQDLSLENEDGTFCMGEAKIIIHGTDAKADAVYAGELEIYDEPKENETEEAPEDDTDYESLAEMYSGTWADSKNDLTLFIQPTDEVEHGCLITIQSEGLLIAGTGVIQADASLVYEGITVNGVFMESPGYFMPSGDLLIWGHDEAVGEFEFGTLFEKLE